VSALLLREPPPEAPAPVDHRTLAAQHERPLTQKTILALRRARRLAAASDDLWDALGTKWPPLPTIRAAEDPERAGEKLREAMGLDVPHAKSWRDPYALLRERIGAVESLGIVVMQLPLPVQEARAFSLLEGGVAVIAISSQDSPSGRSFSLFHEVTHIATRSTGLCDTAVTETDLPSSIEAFCNHVAGAVLVSLPDLLAHRVVVNHGGQAWAEEDLKTIAREFGVSAEVVLRRLLIAGRTTENHYRSLRSLWLRRSVGQSEPKGFSADRPASVIRENGRLFTETVLGALDNHLISFLEAADHLGTKPKWVSEVRRKCFGAP